MPEVEISLSKKEEACIHPHNDDPMVIIVGCDDWKIRRVLVDQESFIYIFYLDAFARLRFDTCDVKAFKGSLVWFVGEQVHAKCYIMLKTTFGVRE